MVVYNHLADFKNMVLCFGVIPDWKNLLNFNLRLSLDRFKNFYKGFACLVKAEHVGLRSGSMEYILVLRFYHRLLDRLDNLWSCLHLFNKVLVYLVVVVEHQNA